MSDRYAREYLCPDPDEHGEIVYVPGILRREWRTGGLRWTAMADIPDLPDLWRRDGPRRRSTARSRDRAGSSSDHESGASMITTIPCDQGKHDQCPGHGLVQGVLRPPHEPDAEGEKVWVTVPCNCSCHDSPSRGRSNASPGGQP